MRPRPWCLSPLLALTAAVAAPALARAHPVPKENHDRTITVRLDRAGTDQLLVTVAYRLEVDEWTVIEKDMPPFKDEANFADFGREKLDAFYGEFTRLYAPILARKLYATVARSALADSWLLRRLAVLARRVDLDTLIEKSEPLKFECVKREHRVRDEQGVLLGHLRCDFEFRASARLAPGRVHYLTFREGNYLLQNGLIDVSLGHGGGVDLLDSEAPTAELKKRGQTSLGPGDDDRLRSVAATFRTLAPGQAPAPASPKAPEPVRPAPPEHDEGLFQLFLHSDHALWLLLLLAAWIGAVHALTPGHGKTLIAAYLVGERGTVWHALVLGLVTTFTHTAVVIAVALGLWLLYPAGVPDEARRSVNYGLQLTMGLLVLAAGVWLLLRRLSGKADHFHLGGHGHHHHHHGHHHHHHHDHAHADHDHDAEGNVVPRQGSVGWWGLVTLGISGGIVPCWDAIAILAVTVGTNMVWLALPLVLAFSAGLASVLVVIGILVVRARGFATSRWGEGRLVRSLPVLSALAVTLIGVWLCLDARP
jgi:nickel/cobalt transporter (NicO) family protein